jgi:hypothetical protein
MQVARYLEESCNRKAKPCSICDMALVFRVVAESPQVLLVSWTPTPPLSEPRKGLDANSLDSSGRARYREQQLLVYIGRASDHFSFRHHVRSVPELELSSYHRVRVAIQRWDWEGEREIDQQCHATQHIITATCA